MGLQNRSQGVEGLTRVPRRHGLTDRRTAGKGKLLLSQTVALIELDEAHDVGPLGTVAEVHRRQTCRAGSEARLAFLTNIRVSASFALMLRCPFASSSEIGSAAGGVVNTSTISVIPQGRF
jgi:hypothetical protein